MKRPVGIMLLAVFVAWLSFGVLSLALTRVAPKTDLPLPVLPAALGLAAGVSGFALALQLWRMRPSAPGWLFAWGALVLSFALFWPVMSPPGRARRGAVAAVALGALVGGYAIAAAARYVRKVAARPADAASRG
jgi:hypothetical protein